MTILCALAATGFNTVFGLMLAWVFVRYNFKGRRLFDVIVDLPFALSTAVAGIAITIFFTKGWFYEAVLKPLDWQIAYTQLGIIIAMGLS